MTGRGALDRTRRSARFSSKLMGLWGGGEGPRADAHLRTTAMLYALGARGVLALPRRRHRQGRLAHRTSLTTRRRQQLCAGAWPARRSIAGDAVDRAARRTGGAIRSQRPTIRRTGKRLWTRARRQDGLRLADAGHDAAASHSSWRSSTRRAAARAQSSIRAPRPLGVPVEHRARRQRDPAHRDRRQPRSSTPRATAPAPSCSSSRRAERHVRRASPVWRNIRMKNRQSSSVLRDGFIYGLDEGILACLDAVDGRRSSGRVGQAAPGATDTARCSSPAASLHRHHGGGRPRPRRRDARASLRELARVAARRRRNLECPGHCRRHPPRPQHQGNGRVRPPSRREVDRRVILNGWQD